MARIRSIHPSLYTDEDFMALSLAARVVLPGLWTECDDHGLFAWKPLTLKARILPADNADMVAILQELKQAGFLCSFEHDGKEYGAVRNFRKFQRPKKPTYVHFMPPELLHYIGLKAESSPPVPHQGVTEGEIAQQMEDVGCRREEGSTEEAKASSGGAAAKLELVAGGKPDWWPKRDRYGRVLGDVTDKLLFDVGKAVLGASGGGQITKLKKLQPYSRDWRAALELLLRADEASDARSWFAAALHQAEIDEPILPMHAAYPEGEYRA